MSVVLGLGGCVDYEVKLTAPVMERLVTEFGITAAELTTPRAVTDERALVVSILGYVASGGGGEHFVASPAALSTFADRFEHKTTLGGTAVRAGIVMDRLGVPSTMHLVTVNDTFRRLLPASTRWINSGREDTFYPHLIVQFDQGLRIGDVVAPLANRLIYVNDPANESMALSADLGDVLRDATVFLVSNFNAMRDERLLDQRLAVLREHMRQLPAEAVTYFEDAAYHEPSFSARVRDALLPEIDIYGLNEDELQAYLGRTVDLLSVDEVAAALTEVHQLIPAPVLVLHTKYWALAMGARAASYSEALTTGTVLAATRYIHGDDLTDDDIEATRRLPRRSAEFLEALAGHVPVHGVPGFLLDVANPTTVGLGDTFVGGFLAAVANRPPQRGRCHPQG
jgi:ADP-dependent phosphofructokinase/glucokinase